MGRGWIRWRIKGGAAKCEHLLPKARECPTHYTAALVQHDLALHTLKDQGWIKGWIEGWLEEWIEGWIEGRIEGYFEGGSRVDSVVHRGWSSKA